VFDSHIRATNCEEVTATFNINSPFCDYSSHAAELPYVFHSEQATG